MGQSQVFYKAPIKRKDYKTEEIEKKYSNAELSQLILYDNVFLYPPKKYFPKKLCEICGENSITKRFQLSENKECIKCYEKVKKENYDYIMKCLREEHYEFEGDCIIENKLYLGGIRSSFLKEEMKKLGVTHILMVGYFMTPLFPDDFIYNNIEVNDNKNENILEYLIKGIKFIDQSGICYIHCQLGKSRSAAFVIAYIMYKNKIHFSEAFDFVRSKRFCAFPNEGFQCQLEDLDIIMSNFDYDLAKCDEFIKNFYENIENLLKTEKEFLEKRRQEKFNTYSDDDDYEIDKVELYDNSNGKMGQKDEDKENIEKEKSTDEKNNITRKKEGEGKIKNEEIAKCNDETIEKNKKEGESN